MVANGQLFASGPSCSLPFDTHRSRRPAVGSRPSRRVREAMTMSRPRPGRRGPSRALPAAGLLLTALATLAASAAGAAPYPRSRVITRITWDTPTYRYAGVG